MKLMTRRRVVALSLLSCLIAALVAASPGGAAKFEWPTVGYPAYDCDSLHFTGRTSGDLIDSLQAPEGYILGRLVMRHNSVTAQKLRLGFVHTAYTGDGDTTEVDEWALLWDSGETGDVGDWFEFWPRAEKVYIKTATATGDWSYEAYYVYTGADSAGIEGVSAP